MVGDKSDRTPISVLRPTKNALDSMKHPGQSYDGLIQELINFWREEHKEYRTGGKAERESGQDDR
ncbi:hypothetical protein ES703_53221 [subsurface metagenome]